MDYQIQISDNAARKILKLKTSEKETAKLRIAVEGGGCNGFQYKFDFDETITPEDIIIKNGDSEAIIDQTSAELISGSIIDYIETLGYAHFEIKNPQAQSSCGCGNSFSL
jgi:iron-sulfur cluster insertion protein